MEKTIEKNEEMNWTGKIVMAVLYAVGLVFLMGIAGWTHNL